MNDIRRIRNLIESIVDGEPEAGAAGEDILTMDVPLFIRLLEHVREAISDDAELHRFADKLVSMKDRTLTMADYDEIMNYRGGPEAEPSAGPDGEDDSMSDGDGSKAGGLPAGAVSDEPVIRDKDCDCDMDEEAASDEPRRRPDLGSRANSKKSIDQALENPRSEEQARKEREERIRRQAGKTLESKGPRNALAGWKRSR
jgi:hypothetical protein